VEYLYLSPGNRVAESKSLASRAALHELAGDVGRRLYLVEEWVTRGDQNCWAQAVALELVSGGRAARRARSPVAPVLWALPLQDPGSGGW